MIGLQIKVKPLSFTTDKKKPGDLQGIPSTCLDIPCTVTILDKAYDKYYSVNISFICIKITAPANKKSPGFCHGDTELWVKSR